MEYKQWVENRYRHPVVIVLASPTAEEACRRNGMDFINMIRPFCVYDGDLFARLTDRADATLVRNFGVRLTRVQCVREVSPTTLSNHLREVLRGCEDMELAFGEQLNRALRCFMKKSGGVMVESRLSGELGSLLLERSHAEWHRHFVQNYVNLVRCGCFETTDHPVGFIYAASTSAAGGVEGILREFKELKADQGIGEVWRNMPCMEEDMHTHFFLLHDVTEGPSAEEVRRLYAAVQSHLGHTSCVLVMINSISNPQEIKCADPSMWIEANPFFMDVPSDAACRAVRYSQQLESGRASSESERAGNDGGSTRVEVEPLVFPRIESLAGKWSDGTPKVTGCYLSPENIKDLRVSMHHYLSQLFTFIERKLRVLNTTVNERRTTTLGKMAAWFRNKNEAKSTTESWVAARGGTGAMYLAGSLEMQMRRAADLSLTLADYDAAANFYRLCRTEALSTVESRSFNKPLIAAAQEGIGICHLLQGRLLPSSLTPWKTGGTSSKNNSDCRLEVAMNDYNACEMNAYALRTGLLLYDFCRTRTPPLVDRTTALLLHIQQQSVAAAGKFYNALLHELLAANAVFLNPPQCAGMKMKASLPNNFAVYTHMRNYLKHCIAAGDAYCNENMFKCALRCYLRALFVYGSVGRCGSWQRICEHLLTALSRVYSECGDPVKAVAMVSVAVFLGTPKYNNPKTALSSLRDFLEKQQEVVVEVGLDVCPHMLVPSVVENTVNVSVNQYHCDDTTVDQQCRLGSDTVATEWHKIEDRLRSHYKEQLVCFPLGARQWTNDMSRFRLSKKDGTGSRSMQRYFMNQEESLQVSVRMRNSIGSALTVESICLLFVSRSEPAKLCKSSDSHTVEFAAGASKTITLNFTPQTEGTYVIVGFAWEVMGWTGHHYFATETYGGDANLAGDCSDATNFKGYVAGMRCGLLLEHAFNNPVPEIESPANIEITVGPPQAWVTVRLEPELPSALWDGEYFHTSLVVTNNSTHAAAHNVTLQRSATNAQLLWFERFGLEQNIDADATFDVAQMLKPKESVSISMIVRGQRGRDASVPCQNNIFLLIGYFGGPLKESEVQRVKLSPVSPSSPSAVASPLRFHRFMRLAEVKQTVSLSSFVLQPVHTALAVSTLSLTIADASNSADDIVRVVRIMAVHRPQWKVEAVNTDILLSDDAAGLVVPPNGAFCVPLRVADKNSLFHEGVTGDPAAASDCETNVERMAYTEEECISVASVLSMSDDRTRVESNISGSVANSAMSLYFMQVSVRGPGTVGEIADTEGLAFYADKGPDAKRDQAKRVDPVEEVATGEPFTPICVAVAWMLQGNSGRSGQVFHFVDPASFLPSSEPLNGKTCELQQEQLCEALVENRSLHPRQAVLLYHVEVPRSAESGKELPDAVLIPVAVRCHSLAGHALLVTVQATITPPAAVSVLQPSSSPSPTIMTFVGRTSCRFLLLPHENHTLNFTAYAFQPGFVQCNAFCVSAVALRLNLPGVDTSLWKSGMSEGAMIRSIRCSASPTWGTKRAEHFQEGLSNGSNSKVEELPASLKYDVQTFVFGHTAPAFTHVSFACHSGEAMESVDAVASTLLERYRDDLQKYEEGCKTFYQRKAVFGASSRLSNGGEATYRPPARLLGEDV